MADLGIISNHRTRGRGGAGKSIRSSRVNLWKGGERALSETCRKLAYEGLVRKRTLLRSIQKNRKIQARAEPQRLRNKGERNEQREMLW